jgi:4-hydroxy-3-polyprenylbenzoate decarboxylase
VKTKNHNFPSRLVVGLTGASGIQFGVRLLEILKPLPIETHLIVSKSAHRVRQLETNLTAKDLKALADVVHAFEDIGCAPTSGSFLTSGMVIAPCSMRTLASIATGITNNALTRAAEVVLKERRRLVLLPRETPLTQQHLKNMLTISEMGGIIAPPVPAFYNNPTCIDDIITHTVVRVLDLFGIHLDMIQRWQDEAPLLSSL